jgi:xylose isomerase
MKLFLTQKKKTMTKRDSSALEYFPGISKIHYEGPNTTNPLAFAHYNPNEIVHGKKMKDWLKFSVCYWHTFRGTGQDPFGEATLIRSWERPQANQLEVALDRLKANFEFLEKLGVEYYTFHDIDIAPKGKSLVETNANLDKVVDLALELQQKTGIKLLWGTQNLFSDKIYACGASTNPNAHIFAMAACQVKKVLEVSFKLGAENVVFWGGREGFSTILNTDVKKELDHMAALFKMAIAYKKKLGATYQFLIEPKPREPMKHQYDYGKMKMILSL